MSKKAKIYALINPINDEIFYVGVTLTSLRARLNGHCSGPYYSIKSGYYKQRSEFIKDIIRKGFRPKISLLEEVDINIAEESERKYYELYKSLGCDLLQSKKQLNCYGRQIKKYILKDKERTKSI